MDSSFLSRAPTHRRVLGNGLRVLVREDHSAPVVAIVTWVQAGYFDEPDEVVGISHVLEHMFFKGTPTRGVGEIAQATKLAGGYLNAGTIYDHTSYYTVLPSSSLAQGLEIQADALQNALLDPDELERELRVIIQEANRKLDNPSAVAHETLFATMFDVHPMRRWRIGTEPVLAGFTRDHVEQFYRAHYTAPNTILVVAGDVTADEVFTLVERLYAEMPATGAPARVLPDEPPMTAPRYREISGDIAQVQVEWGWRVPGPLHPDMAALDVLAVAMGAGRASRLYRHVRDEGHASSVSAWNYTPQGGGVFGISVETEPANTHAALRATGSVLQAVLSDGLTQEEVERAQNVIEARLLRRLETADGQANLLAEWEALGGWQQVEPYHAAIMDVTPAKVLECARRWLEPDAMSALVYRPSSANAVADDVAAFRNVAFGGDAGSGGAPVARSETAAAHVGAAQVAAGDDTLEPVHVEDGVRFYSVAGGNARIVIRQRRTAPLVSMALHCRGGVLAETSETRGFTSLMMRTSVKGTRTRTGDQLSNATEALGGSISAGAGADSLDWALTVPSRHFRTAMDLLLDAALNPRFDAGDAERERALMLADVEHLRDDMHQYPLRLALAAAFGEHPYAADLAALEEALPRLDLAGLGDWHAERVLGGHPHVFVVGDIDDPDRAAAVIGALLEARVRQPGPLHAVPPAWTDEPVERVTTRDKNQTALALAFPGPPRSHEDVYALQLLSAAIAGLGGRLFEELRSRRSLAYSVSASPMARWLGGAFIGYIGTAPEREDEARTELLRELRRTREELLDPDELERARNYLIGAWQIRQQTNGRQLADLAAAVLLGEGLAELREYGNRMGRVSAVRVREAAERWLQEDRLATGIVRGRARSG